MMLIRDVSSFAVVAEAAPAQHGRTTGVFVVGALTANKPANPDLFSRLKPLLQVGL